MRRHQKFISCILALLLCVSATFPALAAEETTHNKISGSEFAKVIDNACDLDVSTAGTTVTRGEAAKQIVQAIGITSDVTSEFTDVANLDSETASSINTLAAIGIVRGYADDTYRAGNNLTISEASIITERLKELFETTYLNGIVQTTKYGTQLGYLDDEENGTYVWKGIPYATSPEGELRWKAPTDCAAWDGIRDATMLGNTAIQISGGRAIGSEDCLNLDIYRPATAEVDLPVLVFIHGGNNQTGNSTQLLPELLAQRANCVVVSPNFRLGALGFNCLPALKTGNALEDSGNYTMLDLAYCLDWVKENIKSFGGNGENITVSGFSSGGRDVMAMLISPFFEGKFQKAIVYSGGMTTANVKDSEKVYARAFSELVLEDGIKGTQEDAYQWLLTEDPAVREYLYGLDAERISNLMSGASIRMAVFPHLFEDGYMIPDGGFDAGTYFSDVPVMMFTGSNEFSAYGLREDFMASKVADDSVFTNAEYRAEAEFICKYGSQLYGLFNAEESAEMMFDYYSSPIYTCWMEWGNDPSIVGERMALLSGCLHGMILPLLSGKSMSIAATYPEAFSTNGYKELSQLFAEYTGNFLRTGNPNGTGLVTWDRWTSKNSGSTNLVLDADVEKAKIYMTNDRISYENVLKQIDADETISEESKQQIISTVFNGRWFSSKLDTYYQNKSLW